MLCTACGRVYESPARSKGAGVPERARCPRCAEVAEAAPDGEAGLLRRLAKFGLVDTPTPLLDSDGV